MIDKIVAFLKYSNEVGLPAPMAKDPSRPTLSPSVTLFFLHVSNALALLSIIVLHFRTDALVATSAACIYGTVWAVLYLLRNLQKASFDLDNKSFSLEGEDEDDDAKNS